MWGNFQSVSKALNFLIPSALTLKTLLVYLHSLPTETQSYSSGITSVLSVHVCLHSLLHLNYFSAFLLQSLSCFYQRISISFNPPGQFNIICNYWCKFGKFYLKGLWLLRNSLLYMCLYIIIVNIYLFYFGKTNKLKLKLKHFHYSVGLIFFDLWLFLVLTLFAKIRTCFWYFRPNRFLCSHIHQMGLNKKIWV